MTSRRGALHLVPPRQRAAAARVNSSRRVVPDNDSAAWDRFAIEAWPTALLIDREGVLRGVYVGDDLDGDIAADIGRLLAVGKRR